VLLTPANALGFLEMFTDTDCSCDSPSTIVLILNDWIPSFIGMNLIITSVDSFSLIVAVCGVTLISSAHDSKFATEITKLFSAPLFVIVVFTVSSFSIVASEIRFASIVGAGS